jgi:MFS family permease
VPSYGRLWASGFFWNLTRWMGIFLCTYMVNDLTGSPLLVQLVGSAFFVPMFAGGALGGVIADRFDRRRTILVQLVMLIPCSLLMGAVVLAGEARTWMIYPFILLVGVGQMVDMTSRRALIFELVGDRRITNAMALEAVSMTGGAMLGNAVGGGVIALLGIGQTFLMMAAFYAAGYLLLAGVPSMPPRARPQFRTSVATELRAGFRYVLSQPALVSVLGVTVIMNTFYFTFVPMVPEFADRLEVGALLAGVLASANAFGSMLGTLVIARGIPFGRGAIYVGGCVIALVSLLVFAAVDVYLIALLGLAAAGAGMAGFATMQSVLVMVSASDEMRGRAMGILSMAIGALPFSMLGLGLVAQAVGSPAAVMGSVITGLIALAAWLLARPEAARMR